MNDTTCLLDGVADHDPMKYDSIWLRNIHHGGLGMLVAHQARVLAVGGRAREPETRLLVAVEEPHDPAVVRKVRLALGLSENQRMYS